MVAWVAWLYLFYPSVDLFEPCLGALRGSMTAANALVETYCLYLTYYTHCLLTILCVIIVINPRKTYLIWTG